MTTGHEIKKITSVTGRDLGRTVRVMHLGFGEKEGMLRSICVDSARPSFFAIGVGHSGEFYIHSGIDIFFVD